MLKVPAKKPNDLNYNQTSMVLIFVHSVNVTAMLTKVREVAENTSQKNTTGNSILTKNPILKINFQRSF